MVAVQCGHLQNRRRQGRLGLLTTGRTGTLRGRDRAPDRVPPLPPLAWRGQSQSGSDWEPPARPGQETYTCLGALPLDSCLHDNFNWSVHVLGTGDWDWVPVLIFSSDSFSGTVPNDDDLGDGTPRSSGVAAVASLLRGGSTSHPFPCVWMTCGQRCLRMGTVT